MEGEASLGMSRSSSRPVLRLVGSEPQARGVRVRLSRVRTAQARIAADYYDRPLVKERILDALLAELNRR